MTNSANPTCQNTYSQTGGLRTGAEQPLRREQTGKTQRMGERDGRREQITALQHEDRARPQESKLTIQQNRRDQVKYHDGGFIERDKGIYSLELHLGKGRAHKKQDGRGRHHDEREPPLRARHRHR
jgi:hypothetical protein